MSSSNFDSNISSMSSSSSLISSSSSSTSDSSSTDDTNDKSSDTASKALLLPEPEKPGQLKRIVLIDGFNLMHHFKDMGLEDPLFSTEKMCPLILVPTLTEFFQNGYIVRIVLRNIPDAKKVSDNYILKLLQDNHFVLFHKEDDAEKDDLLLLELAKKYGAIIISNDLFRNHKGYEAVADSLRIEYDRVATGYCDPKNRKSSQVLKEGLVFKYTINLHDSAEKLIADPEDEDYERVVAAHEKFKNVFTRDLAVLKLLSMYIYCCWCYSYKYPVPDCVSAFIHERSFPMSFDDFRSTCLAYEEAQKKLQQAYHHHPVAIHEEDEVNENEDKDDLWSESDFAL